MHAAKYARFLFAMKQKSHSKETVQVNLYSGGKFWTTFEAPKAFMDYLADYAKKTGITFDEAFGRVLSKYMNEYENEARA